MKKRILLITNGFPFGESERSFLNEEVQKLMEAFDLYILALDNGDKLLYSSEGIQRIERYTFTSFSKTKNVRALFHIFDPATIAETLQFARKHHFSNIVGNLKEIVLYRYHAWEAEQQISRLVREENIDLVYTYWCRECTLAALYVKRRFPKLKVITRFHGYDLYEERAKLGWQPFRKMLAARADSLIFACETGRQYFLSHWGAGDKTYTFYLGSSGFEKSETAQSDVLQLASCSNLIPLKRVEYIIDGLAQLPKTVKVRWNHFGDGSERQNLEKMAREKLPAGGNVEWKFWGQVPNRELACRYRELGVQLFITTSSTEGGVPVSLQETSAMGIPAVGTAVGGIPEVIMDGKTGFLLPQNPETTDVTGAILKYLNLTQEQRQEMSDAAVTIWQEKFDAKKNAQRFAAFLQELVSK